MAGGIDLVKRIDSVLKDFSKNRNDLARETGIPQSTIATWKSSDSFPQEGTIFILAKTLEVSIGWLYEGDIDFEEHDSIKREYSRKSIRLRLYEVIRNKYIVEDSEYPHFQGNYLCDEEKLAEIHKRYFGSGNYGYPTYKEFLNWSKGRYEIDEYWFVRCAQNFNTTIQYLLTGSRMLVPSAEFNTQDFDEKLFTLAKKFQNELRYLDNYSPERLQLAKKLLNELMYLEDYEFKDKNKQKK